MKRTAILLLVFLFLTANFYGQNKQDSPTETVKEFWSILLSEQTDQAISNFTADKVYDGKSLSAEIEFIRAGKLKIDYVLNSEINDSMAKVEVKTIDNSNSEIYYLVYLSKQKKSQKWKIFTIVREFLKPEPIKKIDKPFFREKPSNRNLNCLICS
ncbi:MAG TPA: hypothetical protein PKY59_14730 [Pyrinomonadaceae bacterium]|nr:hypothetical protein [Pyrinomonadaceae bacterium]